MAKQPSSRNICLAMQGTAKAAAQNEARLARVAQCDADSEAIKQNLGKLPAGVQPATDNPKEPATCVGYPTYQLRGFGDPALPGIYGDPSKGR